MHRCTAPAATAIALLSTSTTAAVPSVTLKIGTGSVYQGEQISVGLPRFNGEGRLGCAFVTADNHLGYWMEHEIIAVDESRDVCIVPHRITAEFSLEEHAISEINQSVTGPACYEERGLGVNGQPTMFARNTGPGLEEGETFFRVYDQHMTDDGDAYWVGHVRRVGDGHNPNQEGYQILYRRDGVTGEITADLKPGDMLGTPPNDYPVRRWYRGIMDFSMSHNGEHRAVIGSTIGAHFLAINDRMAIISNGYPWEFMSRVDVNNHGDHILLASAGPLGDTLEDTRGGSLHKPAIGHNGNVVLRDSDGFMGGELIISLTTHVYPPLINDLGQAVILCKLQLPGEDHWRYTFLGASDASRFAETAHIIARDGDEIDTDGDREPDALLELRPVSTGHMDWDMQGYDLSPVSNRFVFYATYTETATGRVKTGHLVTTLPESVADLAPPHGVHDLTDVTTFVDGFAQLDPIADIDRNLRFDLGDIVGFVAAFHTD